MCWVCGQRANGIGCGTVKQFRNGESAGDFKFLCDECQKLPDWKYLIETRALDIHELEALNGAVDAVGVYLKTQGWMDLKDMDELQARMLCKYAIRGFAERLRVLLRASMEGDRE